MTSLGIDTLVNRQRGPRILVVEDNALLAMHCEDILIQLGCTVVKVGRIQAGLLSIDTQPFDGAFLDVDISGESILPIAERLASRAIPFAFVTGSADRHVPMGHGDHPVLSKPLSESRFAEVVADFAVTMLAHHQPADSLPPLTYGN
jgi:CheY-like chemotaxis protein